MPDGTAKKKAPVRGATLAWYSVPPPMATPPTRQPTAATGAIWPVMLPVGAGSTREQPTSALRTSKNTGHLAQRSNVMVI